MRWFIGILVVVALVTGLWWMAQRQQAEPAPGSDMNLTADREQPEPRYPLPKPEVHPAPSTDSPAQAGAEPEPERQSEIEPEVEAEPLPPLSDSDRFALKTLADLFDNDFVEQRIKPEFVIPRTVSLINSLDGEPPALRTLPVRTLDTAPLTEQTDDGHTLLWTEANYARYEGLVAAIESIPIDEAAARYRRHYPLFQQAWEELGETEPYFNDRLIDAIDHLLATPEVELPLRVTPYEGRLHFADESLQEQSWGRKILLRMGPDQAGTIKRWLRDFRQELVASPDEQEQV